MADVPAWASDTADAAPEWAKSDTASEAPKSYLAGTFSDIPGEIAKSWNANVQAIKEGFAVRPHTGLTDEPFEEQMRFAKGVAAIPAAALSPVTGTVRSLVGHPLAAAVHGAGTLIAPETAAKDDPRAMYEDAATAAEQAASAIGPRGVPVKVAAPAGLLRGPYEMPAAAPSLAWQNPARPPVAAPVPPPTDALGVMLSEGQETGALPAIRREQAAARGQLGPAAEVQARDFLDQQAGQVETARERIAQGFDPFNQTIAQTPQEAGAVVSRALVDAERNRAALATQDESSLAAGIDRLPHPLDAADTVANSLRDIEQFNATAAAHRDARLVAQREALREELNPAGGVIARSPQEAADIISGAVGNQSERALAARDAAYQQLRELPGQFHPATFNRIGNVIRDQLNAGTEPIRVNPQTTPIANHALTDLDEILGQIQQQRVEGRIQPRPPITPALVDDTRKRLNSFLGDALSSARSTNNWSDVRAMRGVMNAFDDYVSSRLDRGTFLGDASNVAQTMRNARALHAEYRRNFTPQGPGDTVGSAIQNIVGRYEGQAAPPNQIAQWLYGSGAMPVKIARRMLGIFGDTGPEAAALRQGYLSHIIEKPEGVTAWGPEQVADRIYNALNGPGRALSEIYFSPQTRAQMRAYADSLRQSVEPAVAPNDVVARGINRIVAPGGQPATSAEVADTLFGRTAVGTNPLGVKIAQHIRDTQGPDSPAFTALRQGVLSRLTNAAAGRHGFDAQATAQRIREFLDTARPMAETLFSQEERDTLARYAARLDQHAAAIAAPTDEVERTLGRIAGRDGNPPATPTEVADLLYGRSGAGDRGISVRLAQRLRTQFGESSPEWSAVKQGMFSRLTEATEGKLDWGAQKISERMHEFLNGNGRPLAEAMFAPAEREMLQKFADLHRKLIVPKGGANTSETSTFVAPMFKKISNTLAAIVGGVIGHTIAPGAMGVGEAAGALLAGKGTGTIQNLRNARQIARQMPLIGYRMAEYQRAVAAAQRANQPVSGGTLALASSNLAKALQPLGIDFRQIQGVLPAQADKNDHKARGGRNAEPHQGESDKPGYAAGGRVEPANIDHAPTEAQKKAGNYAKDHVHIHGLDITIENAKGAERRGVDRGGKPWSVTMPAHYGYIKGTVGKDKDHVDVYVGPHPKSPHVFVVDQKDADTAKFDEHKVMLGFSSRAQAQRAYIAGFSDGKGHRRLGHMEEMPVAVFKRWLGGGDTTVRAKGAADAHKLTHKAVGYVSQSRVPGRHCSLCSMFQAGHCTLVRDPINPTGLCRRFDRRKD